MMNKKILSLALAAFSMIPVTAMAQQSATCSESGKSCTEKSAPGRDKQKKAAPDRFEGIQLTETQRARLADVKLHSDSAKVARMAARKEARVKDGDFKAKARHNGSGKDCRQGKDCKQQGDSAAVAARKQARQEAMAARKQAKADYLKQVKEILTPEQYVQFLENNYMQAGARGGKHAKMSSRKGGKGSKADKGMASRQSKQGKMTASKSGKQGKKGDGQGKRGEGRQQKQASSKQAQS